jgi:hypothetical protein
MPALRLSLQMTGLVAAYLRVELQRPLQRLARLRLVSELGVHALNQSRGAAPPASPGRSRGRRVQGQDP